MSNAIESDIDRVGVSTEIRACLAKLHDRRAIAATQLTAPKYLNQ